MHKNQKKFFKILTVIFLLVIVTSGFLLTVSREDTLFYYTVTEVINQPTDFTGKKIRLMGMVVDGSESKTDMGGMAFKITDDFQKNIPVRFTGVRPDMFREGQGVVAEGYLTDNGNFEANHLLVKHTEEYKAPHDVREMDQISKTVSAIN